MSDMKRFAAIKREGDPGTTTREAYTELRSRGLSPIEEGVIWNRSGSVAWHEKEPCSTSARLELPSVVRDVEVSIYNNEGEKIGVKTIKHVVRYEPINPNLRDFTNRSLFDKADGLARQAMDRRDPNRNDKKHRWQGALAAIYGTIERTMKSSDLAEIFCEMAEKAITDINNFSNGTAGKFIDEMMAEETNEGRERVWRRWFEMMDKIYRRCGAPEAKLDEMDSNQIEDLASALGVPHWYVETYRQQQRRKKNGQLIANFMDEEQEQEIERSINCFVEDEEFERKLEAAGRAGSYLIPIHQNEWMRKPVDTTSESFVPVWCVDFETKKGITRREFTGTFEELLSALARTPGSYSNIDNRQVVYGMNPNFFKKKSVKGVCPHCYGTRSNIHTREMIGHVWSDVISHMKKAHNKDYKTDDKLTFTPMMVRRTQRGLTSRKPSFRFVCGCKYPKTFEILGIDGIGQLANTPDEWIVGYDEYDPDTPILAKDRKREIAGCDGKEFEKYVEKMAASHHCDRCGEPHKYEPLRNEMKGGYFVPMMTTVRDLRLQKFEVEVDDTEIIDCQDESYIGGYCEIIDGIPFVERPDWLARRPSVSAWMKYIQGQGDLTRENAAKVREEINERFPNDSKARFVLHTFLNAVIRGRIESEARCSDKINNTIKPIFRQINARNFFDISRQVNTEVRKGGYNYPERTYVFSFLKSMRMLLKADAIEKYFKIGLSEEAEKIIEGIKVANYTANRYRYSARVYEITKDLKDWETFLVREAIKIRWEELRAYATPTERRASMWKLLQSCPSFSDLQNVIIAAELVGDAKLMAAARKVKPR